MSTTEWSGTIPDSWEVVPLKSKFTFGKGLSITKADLVDSGAPVLSYGQIHSKYNNKTGIDDALLRYVPEDLSNNHPESLAVFDGFVFADTSEDLEGCGNCNYVDRDEIFGGYHTIILRPVKGCVDNKYLGYLFQTDAWRWQLRQELTEVKVYSISQKALKSTWILYPPANKRAEIVNFLDRKCGKIDEAIALHEENIEKLDEYYKSLINDTVYKGFSFDKMDETDKWYGVIPEKWRSKRLKYILSERNEHSITGKEEPLSMSQKIGILPTKQMDSVPHTAQSYIGAKITYPNDLVFNKLKAHLGVFSVTAYHGLVSPDYAVYTAQNDVNVRYYEYLFKTPACIGEFIKRSTGVGQGLMRLYTDELFDIEVPFPPINEQNAIAKYLDEKREAIYQAKHKQYQIIEKLEEYRKSIIYHAVTGKIDCGEVQNG